MPTDLFLLGAGGHAKVVLASLLATGVRPRIFDQAPARPGESLLGVVVEPWALEGLPSTGHLAIGDNAARARILGDPALQKIHWRSVVDPRAAVGSSAVLGGGVFVAAQAVIGPEAIIGVCSIINHGAVVDHDARVGACCHIAPNATLGGGVVLGDGVLVGAGAVILPGL